jgi:Flp pilus assembly protein TadB
MTSRRTRRRQGLEGLPITDSEVWEFDSLRGITSESDFRALVASWVTLVIVVALAFWVGSLDLLLMAILAGLILIWWSAIKLRSWRAAGRLMRREAEISRRGHTGDNKPPAT